MKRKHSLKLVIVSLAFLCWLIPILLMVAVMGYYVLSKQDDEQLERLAEQMAASSRICQERLDGAIANSRRISYDKTVQQKYEQYQRGELSYAALYSEVQYYLSVEYSRKKEAAFALIMMNGKEKDESFNVVNSSAGGSYQGILDFWEQDAELVKECAAKLDTAIGFVQNQGRLYLVRNMMNSRFKSWGVIVLCLNKDYCFETLLSGQENVGLSVDLSGENVLSQGISGKLPELTWDSTGRYQVEKGKIYLTFRIKSSDYTLKTLMIHSREELPVPLYGYEYVVIGMLACLLPLCLLMFVVFRRQVNQPIRTLMESAGEIEKGNLGYQISEEAANREFQYLKEAFNQMSGRLKYQFDHIYEEELALELTIQPEDWKGTVQWSTSDQYVAWVDQAGKITCMGGGQCTITAAVGDVQVTCRVLCHGAQADRTKVDTWIAEQTKSDEDEKNEPTQEGNTDDSAKEPLTLNISDMTLMRPGDAYNLVADGGGGHYTWTSGNPSVADVNDGGVVTAVGNGTTTITCTGENGETATCRVHVTYG